MVFNNNINSHNEINQTARLNLDEDSAAVICYLKESSKFRGLWTRLTSQWGDGLTFEPKEFKKDLAHLEHIKWTSGKVKIVYDKSLDKNSKAFYVLMELCNLDKLDEINDLNAKNFWMYPSDFATEKEKIEWTALKVACEISKEFSPPLKEVEEMLINNFGSYLQRCKDEGHFFDYQKESLLLKAYEVMDSSVTSALLPLGISCLMMYRLTRENN